MAQTGRYAAFLNRLLLAGALLFGSHILLWTNPLSTAVPDWLLSVAGHLALASLLLDFVQRYRMRDFFSLLALAGMVALASALLIQPGWAFAEMPRTLVTRVMGGGALVAAEMIGLFLLLLRSGQTGRVALLAGALVIGASWGFWVGGWPADAGYPPATSAGMLAAGAAGLALVGIVRWLAWRQSADLEADAFRLGPVGLALVVVTVGALLIVRLAQGAIDPIGLVVVPLLLALNWAIIWYRGRSKGRTALDGRLPLRPPPLIVQLAAAALFLGSAAVTFALPPINWSGVTPVALIGIVFTACGLAWLPTVALVLGVQGYLKQAQTRQV